MIASHFVGFPSGHWILSAIECHVESGASFKAWQKYLLIPFDKSGVSSESCFVFKRLCYLIAEGFEICSITAFDSDQDSNARIMYRYSDQEGRFCLETELFHAGVEELEACSNLFLDYLQSEGMG